MIESEREREELPLDGVGARLKRAREAAGLSLSDVAARTRIAERHLATIEAGRFNALASRAYAVGFARNFAREVGLDEEEVLREVRAEFDGQEPSPDRYQPDAFEPGDPARVPPARLALIAAVSALAVVIAGFVFLRSFYSPAAELPDLAEPPQASASAIPSIDLPTPAPPAAAPAASAPQAGGASVTPEASPAPAPSETPSRAARREAPRPSPSASPARSAAQAAGAPAPVAAASGESSTVSQ